MEVQALSAVSQLHHADGIQLAGDGLAEGRFAGEELPLDGAEAVAVLEVAEGALLAAGHERRHEVAVPVDLEEPLLVHGLPPLRAHQGRERVIIDLDGVQFLFLQRGAAVADDAALSLAHGIVAGEILQDHILRHEDVPDFHDGSERSLVSHLLDDDFRGRTGREGGQHNG